MISQVCFVSATPKHQIELILSIVGTLPLRAPTRLTEWGVVTQQGTGTNTGRHNIRDESDSDRDGTKGGRCTQTNATISTIKLSDSSPEHDYHP